MLQKTSLKARFFHIPVIILGLLVGGCTEMAARWVAEASYLQQASFAYVHEVHALRQWIRSLCRDSLARSVNEATQAGDEVGLRKLLADHYPGLVTTSIIAAARDDPAGVLAAAPGCESRADHSPDAATDE